jgi:hypothetical protein
MLNHYLHFENKLTRIYRAGGIISETNFKFFIQFCTYAALFCFFLLVVSAYFTAEMTKRHHSSSPVISIIAM